jgi:CobQ-like glutamine amidotransferase family enzyme
VDLRICHLYGDLMSIYGDRGNVLTLRRRAEWRGIDVSVDTVSAGDRLDPDRYDLYFFGGGQDAQQDIVAEDLQGPNGAALKAAVAGGAAVLSVCGGYQLLGHYYRPFEGPELKGVSVLDAHTVAGRRRFIGNVVASAERPLVGFENHSGLTYLGPEAKPLATVVVGAGNNGEDRTEGAVQGKVIGTYLHGSLLPKNPWLADRVIGWALARRHGDVALAPLDDGFEERAHGDALRRAASGVSDGGGRRR